MHAGLSLIWSEVTHLNPESGLNPVMFLCPGVEPCSNCLELSGVNVRIAFLSELLKGLDS